MRKTLTLFVVAGSLIAMSQPATAETELKVSGQVRVRGELDKREFDSDATTKQFTDVRTRVKIEAIVDTNTHAVIQFQDSRRLGNLDQFGNPQSGKLTNGSNVDVHQAYLQIDHLFWYKLTARAGRFEVNLGNERVFGAVGWSNIGRTWEGATVWANFENVKFTAYGLKALELNSSSGNQDFDLYGVTAKLPASGLELFGFLEHDARYVSGPLSPNRLDRVSLGTYYKNRFEKIDVEANGVFQTGDQGSKDISAFLFTGELGYNFEGSGHVRFAGGIDYSSGDDGTDTTRTNTYNNMYYTGHKFRGYMDYFIASNREGLIDAMFRSKFDIAPKWTVKGDFHYFKTAEDYTDGTTTSSDVGVEIDLAVKTTRVSGVAIQNGISLFFPKDNFASYSGFAKNDVGVWGYSMLTANF